MSKTQSTGPDTRFDRRAVEMAVDRLRWHCGKNAPRGWAAVALSVASWADLSPDEVHSVLEHFEDDPDPVPNVDFLPEPIPLSQTFPPADVLRMYIGRYVAVKDGTVIYTASSSKDVIGWLRDHGLTADSTFRVPDPLSYMPMKLQVSRDGVEGLVRIARDGLAAGKDRTEMTAEMYAAILVVAAAGMSTTELFRGFAAAIVRIAELPEPEPVMHRDVPREHWEER